MSILALIAITIGLIAFYQIVRVLIGTSAPEQSLKELECEMLSLDAECALAVQRSRDESIILQPDPTLDEMIILKP